jgi:ABC-type transporter MlaC component
MTALQIFFNSLRSRTIVHAIWMPVLIGILLIGASIPSKHATAPAKPHQLMQSKAKPSSKAINRQRARGAGKTKPHTNRGMERDVQITAAK